jgi:tRNA-2-methylthio-N6-dimethylallyladenosine synthase
MKQYHIWTIGCQMNHADSIRIGSALEQTGYTYTEQVDEADLIILNTCSVRQRAEDSAQGKLGSLVPLKRQKKDLVVAVTGCMVPPNDEASGPSIKNFRL